MAKKKLLDRIREGIAKEGLVARTNKARTWLMKKVQEVRLNSSAKLGMIQLSNDSKKASKTGMKIGRMYFYMYDPKTKDKLPYYDIFPVVIPIDYKSASQSATGRDAGFIGLNLHYLPPRYRLALLDQLYTITNNDLYNETTKIRLSYGVLINNKNLFRGMPCLKWYLFKHLRSSALEIVAEDWETIALLPFEDFKKQSKESVWKESLNKSRKYL